MKVYAFLFISLLSSGAFCEDAPEVTEEEGVLVLNEANFEHVVTNNKFVLVEFYAPWCGHCKALAPEYAKAAAQLNDEDSDIRLAKVDATKETALATKHKVRGYPTLKFFRDGKPQDYQGGRQAPDIIKWLKKRTGPPCKVLATADDVQAFKDGNEVAVIGSFDDAESKNAKLYEEVAGGIDDLPFGIVNDAEVAKAADMKADSVSIFKQFDEGRADFEGEELNVDDLTKFCLSNRLRLLNEFTPETAPKIFGGDVKVHCILFVSKESDGFSDLHESFKNAAKEFKGEVLFVFVDADKGDNNRVMEFFGISSDTLPEYRIIKMAENMAKFKPDEKDMSTEAVVQFTKDVMIGRAQRHLKTQDIPEDWDKNPVTVLVGKNFNEVAFDQSKKVFVEFYAPWCGHCKSLKPTWEKLGEHFKDDSNVVIAMMDATANEVADLQITGFPTLKFFPAGTDEILDYKGDRSVDAMAEYVTSNGEKVGADDSVDDEGDLEEDVDDEDDLPDDDDDAEAAAKRDEL